jgi:hypothetical protein
VTEQVANVRYELFAPHMRLRIDGAALGYSAAGSDIRGTLPIGARLDVALQAGDTLTAYVRSASQPLDLTARETAALSTAGTSTVELESSGLAAPALGGVRATKAFPVGDMVLAFRGGLEFEPTPSGAAPVYWRGTTLRGGLALTSHIGDGGVVLSVDAARSSADSLNGRNLFPGGGTMTFQLQGDASVLNPFDILEDERWPVRTALFYSRPFNSDRTDQPNLLIPDGDLLGGFATMFVPAGDLSISPTLQYLRETSSSGSTTGIVRSTILGNAWTMQAGLDVTVPMGSVFELTPTAGYTFGSVGSTFSQAATLRRGRGVVRTSGFDDAIRGHFFGVQISASF